jgi:hypothetical protein
MKTIREKILHAGITNEIDDYINPIVYFFILNHICRKINIPMWHNQMRVFRIASEAVQIKIKGELK